MKLIMELDDWQDEYQRNEPDVRSEGAAIITQVRESRSAMQIARFLIVGRERGDTPKDILPENKMLLNAGAAHHWMQTIAQRKTKADLGDGKSVEVREYVGTVKEGREAEGEFDAEVNEDVDKPIVYYKDPEAIRRIRTYMARVIPGHIYNRLAILLANGEDVGEAAEELKDKIDEIVDRLSV